MLETALPEGGRDLVGSLTDPGDLGLGDSRDRPERFDQLVDRPGGDPAHVGLHLHSVESLVDATLRFQDGGEEAAPPKLGEMASSISQPWW